MKDQLDASPQPAPRRVARRVYWRSLALSFRFFKRPFSELRNHLFLPRSQWPGHDDVWENLEAYAEWLPRHVRWRADPLNGALDFFPDRATIAAQFRDKGRFEEDCDGLAYFSAQNVQQFVADPSQIFVVTIVLDPYTFAKDRLLYAAHVICVFRHERAWRVISNDTLYRDRFDSFAQAVQYNPYCTGHPVLWVEVRTPNLRRLFSGPKLERFDPDSVHQAIPFEDEPREQTTDNADFVD